MRTENGERDTQIERGGNSRNITWNKFDFMQKQTISIPNGIAHK